MRRFDKLKNIREKNKSIEKEYLLETASLTSKSYRNRLLIESVMNSDDEEQLFNRFILEACEEHGVNIEEIINENEYEINISNNGRIDEAGVAILSAAAILSGGKVIEILGSLITKIVNYLRRKGIMKGDQISKKNIGEETGSWFQKIVKKTFEKLAWLILKPIAHTIAAIYQFNNRSTTAKGQKEIHANSKQIINKLSNKGLIENVASALFYAAIVFVGIKGAAEIHTFLFGTGQGALAAVFELITTGAKLYEVILFMISFFLTTFVQKYKNYNPSKLAHTLADCLENPGGVRQTIDKLKQYSSKEKSSELGDCINKKMGEH
jgi:hypothetical protein